MTAQEARYETMWRSLPDIVQLRIRQSVEHGILSITFYKSVSPDAFQDIKSTLFKLENLDIKPNIVRLILKMSMFHMILQRIQN